MAGKDERTRKNAWLKLDDDERRMAFDLGTRYIDFLNQARTERETTEFIEAKAREYGFVDLKTVSGIQPRQKLYMTRKNKISALISVGDAPLEDGFNIVASHVDCPRLDLKPMPLYETDGMVLLKTHYYGGIKKYQWPALRPSVYPSSDKALHWFGSTVPEFLLAPIPTDILTSRSLPPPKTPQNYKVQW
jgi:hypothetical protein